MEVSWDASLSEFDIVDLATVGAAFGSTSGSVRWKHAADLNGDGVIDIVDLVTVASHFGFVAPGLT